jgi:hypothetical protein
MLVKLVTELRPGELRVRLRGLWRSIRIPLEKVNTAAAVTFDPVRDWGGYGFGIRKRERPISPVAAKAWNCE